MGTFIMSNILAIIINFSQIFLQFSIITYIFRHKVAWWKLLLWSAVISLFLFECPAIMLGIFGISTLLFYFLAAKMRFMVVILAVSMQLFLSMLAGNVIALVYYGLFPAAELLYMGFLTSLLLVLLLCLAVKYKADVSSLIHEEKIYAITIAITIIALAAYFNGTHYFTQCIPRQSQILNAFWMFTMQFVLIYIILTLNRLTAEIEQHEFHRLYTDTLEKSLDSLSGYKHSHRNMVNTMLGFLDLKRYDELKDYLSRQENDIRHDISRNRINAVLRDNMPYLYGNALAIVALCETCETGNISFSIDVPAKRFEVKTMDGVQLSRIVGNLLSNAYEAAKHSREKKITLTIDEHGRTRMRFLITNSVDSKVDTSDIFSKGSSSKDSHSGFGLYEVKAIIDKREKAGFDVELNISCTDSTFSVELFA